MCFTMPGGHRERLVGRGQMGETGIIPSHHGSLAGIRAIDMRRVHIRVASSVLGAGSHTGQVLPGMADENIPDEPFGADCLAAPQAKRGAVSQALIAE